MLQHRLAFAYSAPELISMHKEAVRSFIKLLLWLEELDKAKLIRNIITSNLLPKKRVTHIYSGYFREDLSIELKTALKTTVFVGIRKTPFSYGISGEPTYHVLYIIQYGKSEYVYDDFMLFTQSSTVLELLKSKED